MGLMRGRKDSTCSAQQLISTDEKEESGGCGSGSGSGGGSEQKGAQDLADESHAAFVAARSNPLGDLYMLDPSAAASAFTLVQSSGTPPAARCMAGFTSVAGRLFVFGGFGANGGLNDLHVFDPSLGLWNSLKVGDGTVPSPRYWPGFASTNGRLLLWGGAFDTGLILGVTLNDFYSFDLTTLTWATLTLADPTPARRYGAAFAASQGSVYLFGGYGGPGSSYFDDLWSAKAPRDAPWPIDGLPGHFMEIYDWDTVVADNGAQAGAATPLLANPVQLCTSYFPCSLLVDGSGSGVLSRAARGMIACVSSQGCTSVLIRGLRVECDGQWAPGSLLQVDGASLSVRRSTFVGCAAKTDGGTVKGYGGGGRVSIEGSFFVNSRSALNGGAVAMLGGLLSVSNTTFVDCSSASGGGAISANRFVPRYGSSELTQASVTVRLSRFSRCWSGGPGGAVAASSAAAEANLSDCDFTMCFSQDSGGAVAVTDLGSLSLARCAFQGNRAGVSGGAILAKDAPLSVSAVTGTGNTAVSGGGGVLFWTGRYPPNIVTGRQPETDGAMCGPGNTALYGSCLGSTYHRLEVQGLPTAAVPSFPGVSVLIQVLKKDAYNQTITTDSSSLVQALTAVNSTGSSQGGPAPELSGGLGSFESGVAALSIQIKPLFSLVVPSSLTAILRAQPTIYFKAVDAETLGNMRTPIIETTMTSGNSVCPVGSVLLLGAAYLGLPDRLGTCSVCGPGTYSVSPLAGIGVSPSLPACLNCPQTGDCKGGSEVIFSLGEWVVSSGVYRLMSCPLGYQLINSDDYGTFQHDLQHCRQCQPNQYILNPNRSDFSCQDCPTGAVCNGTTLAGKTPGSVWMANMTSGLFELQGCPVGYKTTASSPQVQQCDQWTALIYVSVSVTLATSMDSFTATNQIGFRRALARTAAVQASQVMISRISSGRRSLSGATNVDSWIQAIDASAAAAISRSINTQALNSQLEHEGIPSASVQSTAVIDNSAISNGTPISLIVGVSIGGFFVLLIVGSGCAFLIHKLYRRSLFVAFTKALQNAKAGDVATQAHLPLELQQKYTAQKILGVGAFGCIVQAERKGKKGKLSKSMRLGNSANTNNNTVRSTSTNSAITSVAFKFILPSKGTFEQRELNQLRREANTLELFTTNRCENAVLLIGDQAVRIKKNLCWFTMEDLKGMNMEMLIKDAMKSGSSPVSDLNCISLSRNVLGALSVMHGEGLVHRDIKPSNIMCGKDLDTGEQLPGCLYDFKLIDFGTVLGVDESLAKADMMTVMSTRQLGAGTPPYMSPEMFVEPEKASYPTDLWSLGVSLFELATGSLPFKAESDWLWSVSIAGNMDERAPSVLDLLNHEERSRFDNGLAKVIAKSLEKRVHNRYRTADEMCDAVYNCLVSRGEAFYSVFISYRVASEAPLARLIFDDLNHSITPGGHRVTVYWDAFRLVKGENWKDGFANGLLNSLCILPLLSYGATAPLACFPEGEAAKYVAMGWDEMPVGRRRLEGKESDPEDSVLQELQIAGALLARRDAADRQQLERGILQFAYPVLVGCLHPEGHPEYPGMGSFFDVQAGGGAYPTSPSPCTAKETAALLERAGLPEEAQKAVLEQSVAGAVKAITDLQGCRLWDHPTDIAEVELTKGERELIGTGCAGPSVNLRGYILTEEQRQRCAGGLDERQLRMLKAQVRAKRAEFHRIIDQAVDAAAISGIGSGAVSEAPLPGRLGWSSQRKFGKSGTRLDPAAIDRGLSGESSHEIGSMVFKEGTDSRAERLIFSGNDDSVIFQTDAALGFLSVPARLDPPVYLN